MTQGEKIMTEIESLIISHKFKNLSDSRELNLSLNCICKYKPISHYLKLFDEHPLILLSKDFRSFVPCLHKEFIL